MLNRLLVFALSFSALLACSFDKELKTRSKLSSGEGNRAGDPAVGNVPAIARVSAVGEALVDIPISIIPAGNDLTPNISIGYGSNRTEAGILGVGWSLNSGSMITRCGATEYFDGYSTGVTLGDSDRLCIDGQKLVLVKGEYWKDNSEYRLYMENYSKILYLKPSVGQAGHFQVWKKDGEILSYGLSESSRIVKTNSGDGLSWALSEIRDRKDNFVTFEYLNSAGIPRLSKIHYGGNVSGQVAHNRRVDFIYESRPSAFSQYYLGEKKKDDSRLKKIEVYGEDKIFWEYRFEFSERSQGRQANLTAVEQCSAAGRCLPPTKFSYRVEELGFSSLKTESKNLGSDPTSESGIDKFNREVIDVNNDSYDDVVLIGQTQIQVAFGSTGGLSALASYPNDLPSSYVPNQTPTFIFDMNDDGFVDIVSALINYEIPSNEQGFYIAYGSATGFTSKSRFLPYIVDLNFQKENHFVSIADFDRDRRPDFFVFLDDGVKIIRNTIDGLVQVNGGKILLDAFGANHGYTLQSHVRSVVDLNGDGFVDIAGFYRDGVYVSYGIKAGFDKPMKVLADFGSDTGSNIFSIQTDSRTFSDMNNDGLLDLVGFHNDGVLVALNNGMSFEPSELWTTHLGFSEAWDAGSSNRFTSDFNGDGFQDFVGVRQSGIEVYLGRGGPIAQTRADLIFNLGFNDPMANFLKVRDLIHFDDFNADGLVDLVFSDGEGLYSYINSSRSSKLIEFVDGYQKGYRFEYKDAKDTNVYTRSVDKVNAIDTLAITSELCSKMSEMAKGKHVKGIHYAYENALFDRSSLGFLGYSSWTERQEDSGTFTRHELLFDLTEGLLGLPSRDRTYSSKDKKILVETINDWNSVAQSKVRHIAAELNETKTIRYGQGQEPLVSIVSKTRFDRYGNVTLQVTETIEQNKINRLTATSLYGAEDPNLWILGRLTEVKTLHEEAGRESIERRSSFSYDNQGLLLSETNEPGTDLEIKKIFGRQRNPFGLVDSVQTIWTDSQSKGLPSSSLSISNQFDGLGFKVASINALGHERVQSNDPFSGLVLWEQDLNGLRTSYSYDDFLRKVKVVSPEGHVTRTDSYWCDMSCPVDAVYFKKTSSNGTSDSFLFFDALSREIKSSAIGFGDRKVSTLKVYLPNGLLEKESLPFFDDGSDIQWQTNSYDELGRLVEVKRADGSSESSVERDNVWEERDGRGFTTKKFINSRGAVEWIRNAKNEVLTYDYDAAGRLIEIKDPTGSSTKFKYDLFDRRIEMQDPNTGTTKTTYNALGLPAVTLDSLQTETRASYDLLGRKISLKVQEKSGDAHTDTWDYDKADNGRGLLSSIKGSGFQENYSYDSFGRTTNIDTQIREAAFSSGISYDELGRPASVRFPSGLIVVNEYDKNSQLLAVLNSNKSKKYIEVMATAADGSIVETRLGNGVKVRNEIDPAKQLLENLLIHKSDGTLIESRSYTYDPNGNLESRTNASTGKTESFAYDELNRLRTVSNEKGAISTDYDERGNISRRSDLGDYSYGGTCDGVKAGPHAVTAVSDKRYCYNARGQMTKNGNTIIAFGLANKPTLMRNGLDSSHFLYAPNGDLVERIDQSANSLIKTLKVSESYEVIDTNGTLTQRHYVGGFLQIDIEANLIEENYLHFDSLGSVISVTDSFGNVIERMDYDPWGLARSVSTSEKLYGFDAKSTQRGFTGHERIGKLDLVHMKGRVYDPTIGRFLSADPFIQDPSNLQSLNRYSYVWNNPLSATDPSGYFSLKSVGKGISNFVKNPGKILSNAGGRLNKWVNNPNNQRLVAALAISVASAGYMAPGAMALAGGSASWGGWVAGLAVSASGGYTSGYVMSNGNLSYARKSAVAAMAFFSVGQVMPTAVNLSMKTTKVAAHGLVGGLVGEAQGESFASSFAAGAVSEVFTQSGAYDRVTSVLTSDSSQLWAGTMASAIVGGMSSELTGGSFENGAITAAFGRLFNEIIHKLQTTGGVTHLLTIDRQEIEMCDPDGFRGTIVSEKIVGTRAVGENGIEADYTIENLVTAGGIAKFGVTAVLSRKPTDLIAVSRWGRPGLEAGDWVMKGNATKWNYVRSFKWEKSDFIKNGNIPAAFKSGESFMVPRSSVKWPSGAEGMFKGLYGQRKYLP